MKAEKLKAFTPLEQATDANRRALSYGLNPISSQLVRERNSLTGFTLTEILTVIVIITILAGILMPALNQVKKLAKETKQKAEIGSIDVGLNLYRNDFGEYPPSHGKGIPPNEDDQLPTYNYCGAQTLAEAMFGRDLLGFHPDSQYDPCDGRYVPATVNARKDAYLDRTNISVFNPYQVFNRDTYDSLALKVLPTKYVICDVFTAVNRQITLPGG